MYKQTFTNPVAIKLSALPNVHNHFKINNLVLVTHSGLLLLKILRVLKFIKYVKPISSNVRNNHILYPSPIAKKPTVEGLVCSFSFTFLEVIMFSVRLQIYKKGRNKAVNLKIQQLGHAPNWIEFMSL